jgi:hypothetical protein
VATGVLLSNLAGGVHSLMQDPKHANPITDNAIDDHMMPDTIAPRARRGIVSGPSDSRIVADASERLFERGVVGIALLLAPFRDGIGQDPDVIEFRRWRELDRCSRGGRRELG